MQKVISGESLTPVAAGRKEGLEPATSGVTGVTRAFHPASSSRIMRAVIRLLRLFVPPSTVRSFA